MNNELIHSIYTESLYSIEEPLLVVLDKPWSDLTVTQIELLSKILTSIKQSLGSVKIVYQKEFDSSSITSSAKVILFGTKVKPEVTPYTISNINKMMLIQADALDQLDDAKKKSLWTALRQMNG